MPGLAITGLLLTGLAGLVRGIIFGDGQALLAAAVDSSAIGWLVLR
jgi:hypothetical protein